MGPLAPGHLCHDLAGKAHAVDGNYDFSGTDAWDAAWRAEIKVPGKPLSDYAATLPHEGFAEFGRLVFGGNHVDAKNLFPKCWAFWKEKGLV